jgi:[NiFe] hydrogenase diaphorase moiety large subunit
MAAVAAAVPTAGAFKIFGEDRDLFEIARNFAHFFAHGSCGFCKPWRVGTNLLRDALDKIAEGRGPRYEINELMRLAELLRRTSHCGLGQTAGNPMRDTWLKFRPAYERSGASGPAGPQAAGRMAADLRFVVRDPASARRGS